MSKSERFAFHLSRLRSFERGWYETGDLDLLDAANEEYNILMSIDRTRCKAETA